MAKSGTIQLSVTSAGSAVTGWIEWTESEVNAAANTSKVTAKLVYRNAGGAATYSDQSTFHLTVNGSTVHKTSGATLAAGSTVTVLTQTVTVAHNADGAKSVTVSGGGALTGTIGLRASSGSGTAVLTAIPRASVPTVSQSAIDMGQTVRIRTNAKNSAFCHRIWYTFGGSEGYDGDFDTTTLYNWSDLTPRLELARRIPNAASGTCTVYLRTFTDRNMTTRVGEDQTVTFTLRVPASVKPAADMTVELVHDAAVPAGWDAAVQGHTRLRYALTGDTSADYGASVAGFRLEAPGEVLTAQTGATKPLTAAGEVTIRGMVRDSRGHWSDAVSRTVTVWDYATPAITASHVRRCTADGTAAHDGAYLTVLCGGTCSDVGGRNSVTARLRWRRNGGNWGGYVTLPNGTETVVDAGLLADASYEAELSVTDALGTGRTVVYPIPTAAVAFHLKSGGHAAAFGKYAEGENELELAEDWDLRCHGAVMADHVAEDTAAGGWEIRRWRSGRVELWKQDTVSVDVSTAAGSLYCSPVLTASLPAGLLTAVTWVDVRPVGGSNYLLTAQVTEVSDDRDWFRYSLVSSWQHTSNSRAVWYHVVGRGD